MVLNKCLTYCDQDWLSRNLFAGGDFGDDSKLSIIGFSFWLPRVTPDLWFGPWEVFELRVARGTRLADTERICCLFVILDFGGKFSEQTNIGSSGSGELLLLKFDEIGKMLKSDGKMDQGFCEEDPAN